MARKTTGLKEIAQALNLSPGTVSRALSGRGEVAQETRALVADYAARLKYSVPRMRQPRETALRRISVCVGNPCISLDGRLDPTFVGFHYVVALERAASSAHVSVMVGFVNSESDNLHQMPLLQADETQGVILVYPYPEAFVQTLAQRMPVVSIEHVYPSVSLDTIGPAHSVDAMSAVDHLHRLGHQRIAYVGDEEASGHRLTTGLRHAGYVSGLTRCGLPYRASDVVNVQGPFVPKTEIANWVKGRRKDGVTAVITAIDRHGYLLWEQLPALGVRIPKDLSLVGIGGIHRAPGQPQLTTWRCDYDTIADTAISTLRARHTGGRSIDLYQEISSVFIEGSSVAPPPRV